MAFHTVVYQSASITGNTANQAVNAVTDGIMLVQNNLVTPQQPVMLLGAAAIGSNVTKARVYSPYVLQTCHAHIRPTNSTSTVPTSPAMFLSYNNPISFRALEGISVDITSNTSASFTGNVVLLIGDAPSPVPQGSPIILHGTSTTTVTANAWTQSSITWDDNLPSWQFATVGWTYVSATCIASRLNFPGQVYRPGSLGCVSLTNTEHLAFQTRQFGTYGQFRPPIFPLVEAFCTSADTSADVFMEIIKVGN